MKKIRELIQYSLVLSVMLYAVSCSTSTVTPTPTPTPPTPTPTPTIQQTTFKVTLKNTAQVLDIRNIPNALTLNAANSVHSITFKADKGTLLTYATSFVGGADWFYSTKPSGIALFDASGNPRTGDITSDIAIWDAGTLSTGTTVDSNTSLRRVRIDVTAEIRVQLTYNASTKAFLLQITNLLGNSHAITPTTVPTGLIVLHSQANPLFTSDLPVRNNGLKKFAEQVKNEDLLSFFQQTQTSTGNFSRLSPAFTSFSPGVVYAFKSTTTNPLFTEGQSVTAISKLESLAEDRNPAGVLAYLQGLPDVIAVTATTGAGIQPGQSQVYNITVPKGYKLGFATMFVESNDWFISIPDGGIDLFNSVGTAISSTPTSNIYLFDAGTEADENVGSGPNQAERQSAVNTGPVDTNNKIRRVQSINRADIGGKTYQSNVGVVGFGDSRGGYNLMDIKIEVVP